MDTFTLINHDSFCALHFSLKNCISDKESGKPMETGLYPITGFILQTQTHLDVRWVKILDARGYGAVNCSGKLAA